ncbi:MAG: sn-glycerol-3-phosphate ABC transporter ATP-binding protein UgpC [Ilumatobacteraceae bacterium]
MATVTLEGVNKVYENGFHAIHDLNLDIADGEFLVLVGPSGCGKSTALRMIAGLETISGGDMSIGDRAVNDVEPKDRDIAMVFQNYALYPHMTVFDNIGFALKLARIPIDEIDTRVRKAAAILELEPYLDRKPGQLSGGQRQRAAMGRAIVRQPAAFLMDEPLSNLDAKLRVQMRAEIARLQRELGVTTFYVTHDQVEAMTMGDRVAVIKDGYLQQVDTPQRLYDNPANVFVAAFIGSPSMNLYDAELTVEGDGGSVKLGSESFSLARFHREEPRAAQLPRQAPHRRHPAGGLRGRDNIGGRRRRPQDPRNGQARRGTRIRAHGAPCDRRQARQLRRSRRSRRAAWRGCGQRRRPLRAAGRG